MAGKADPMPPVMGPTTAPDRISTGAFRKPPTGAQAFGTQKTASPPVKRPKILVVDDELDVLRSTQMLLERLGYLCVVMPEADHLVEVAEAERPDLIIQDVLMPGFNITDLVLRLRQSAHLEGVPIVLFSASEDLAERAAELDAAGYLNKPFAEQQLREILERILGPAPPMQSGASPREQKVASKIAVEAHREIVRAYFHEYRNTLTALNNYSQFLLNSREIPAREREASEEMSRLLLDLERRSDALRTALLGE